MVIKIGYKLWDDQNKKVIRSKDVIFNASVIYKDKNTSQFESLVHSKFVYFEPDDIPESDVTDKICQNPQGEEATAHGVDLPKEPVPVRN